MSLGTGNADLVFAANQINKLTFQTPLFFKLTEIIWV